MEVLRDMLGQIDEKRRDKMRQETVSVPVPQRYNFEVFLWSIMHTVFECD